MKLLKRTLLTLFLALNIIAAFHAYKFTHFYAPGTTDNRKPEQMNALEKMRMIFFGVRLSKTLPKHKPDTTFVPVTLATSNGLHLSSWYIPVANSKGTVLLFHGYGGNKGPSLTEAAYFRRLGYSTLLTDFRGHGNSEGNSCTVGYREADDVKAAYDHIRKQNNQPIILWGVSMGAAAIMKAIPEYHLQPQKVILECPFATLTDAVKSRMRAVGLPQTPFAQLLTCWGGIENGFWGPGFQPAREGEKIKMPVLLCWGAQDIRVTRQETNMVYRHLGSKQKQLLIFNNSGHQSFCRNEGPKWKNAITLFLAAK
jgi:alpha-beta hydrolase superfamily lysophospholipase